MRLLFSLALIILSVVGFTQSAQKQPNPLAGKMDPARLATLDKVFNEYVSKKWVNGGVIIIHRNNQLVYHKALGYHDLEAGIPMKTDAVFRLASQTKAITSVAIMMLMEQGKLLLDDPVSLYLPSFKNQTVIKTFNPIDSSYTTEPVKRDVTIRQLLTHTSGIGYAQIGDEMSRAVYGKAGIIGGLGISDPNIKLADQMNALGKTPLMHQPGEKYTYGLSIDVLGYLVEVISGQDLATFFKKNIFDPLGMKDTWFYQPTANHKKLVPLYTDAEDGKTVKKIELWTDILYRWRTDYPNLPGTYYSGGAGLSGTAQDYAQFIQMLLNDGMYNGKRILSRSSVRLMTTNQMGDLVFGSGAQTINQFGFGFMLITKQGSAASIWQEGTYTGGGAFVTNCWIDPKEKLTVQMMVNLLPFSHSELVEKVKNTIYQSIID